MIRKYTTAYKNSLSQFLQYRLNLGLLIVSHIFSLSGLIYLWLAVYASGQTIGNYTLPAIILYYIILTILRTTISDGVGMGFRVCEEINQGLVANYLLKPFNYSLEQFIKLLGQATINVIFMAPVVLFLVYVGRNYILLPNLFGWLSFIGVSTIALTLYYLVYYLASLSSFWIHRGGNVIYAVILTSNLLNGSILPLDIFPTWYQPIGNLLPFQFLIFLPIQTFLGRVEDWPQQLLTAAIWIVIFIALIVFTWKKGVKKFEAVGR